MNVITAKKTADTVVKTLSNCRNEESFTQIWSHADVLAQKIKIGIEVRNLPSEMPRCLEPDHHANFRALLVRHLLQRKDSSQQTAKDHFRITVYYTSIDKVVSELQSSFEGNDQEILCALGKIVFSYSPSINNIQTISSFYGVDSEMLSSEKSIFENYDCRDPCQGKNAAVMVKTMHQQVSFGQIMFSPPNKIFPVRRCLNLLLLNCCVPPIPPKTAK